MRTASETHPSNLWLIAGPTAVGKSELALLLAARLRGEIVSADSMQVYRDMDVGTAKPSAEERARIPHHVMDVVPVGEPFDVAAFVTHAQAAIREIQSCGGTPIVCGGTGLYIKALLEGLGQSPASDPKLRAELEQTPLEQLLEELRGKDPATYQRIDRNNPRRVYRALEVLRLTGRSITQMRAEWSKTKAVAPPTHIGLSRPATDLSARIEARVDWMFAQGLVEETRKLLESGLRNNRNAMQALGYRQVIEHLCGERSLTDTIELVKARTRRYAKKQMTWFRGQLSLRWLEVGAHEVPEQTVERLLELPGSAADRC